jgi:serine/threonine-protein kinase
MIGRRIGPYEVTSKLGEGGMGEVYRATDTKLRREVAIKVLPAAFVEDRERLDRFEREAQLLAQLHHPNIASIFGLEESDGTRALVMELVEGPTLADRLANGPLPLDESLAIARQIAEALEEAHEKGIVHRDLKPQNVKASREGKVKVLDFGLAKAMDPAATASGASGSASQLAASPTLTLGATQMGVILGTAAYMSPEQAKGVAVDKRADIWAFGVVLHEMLSGRRLFEGDSVPETLAGVLKTEIDLAALPADLPAALRRLLRRCLERNPKNRLHDVADARIVIDDVLAGRHEERPAVAAGTAGRPADRPSRWLALAAVALVAGGVGGWFFHRGLHVPAPVATSRWALALPEGYTLSAADVPQLALSRDGRLQAAVVQTKGSSQILLRESDVFEPRLLPGTEGAIAPFFSPDGAWIGYFRDDALMKMPVAGGPPVRLAAVQGGHRGGTWSEDGFIYYAAFYAQGLTRVAASGGAAEPATHLDLGRGERTHRWPEALPGGEALLFTCDTVTSSEYYDDARIEAVRPATGERRVLVEGASQARYSPSGHLVFARGGSLFAIAFDPRSLEVSGVARPVVQSVSTDVGSGAVQFAIAGNGVALWAPGGLSAAYEIVWVGRDGVESPVPVPPAPYGEVALSPDGRRLALVGGPSGISDLWIADLERGAVNRLTFGDVVRGPVWTPDGSRIAYSVVSPQAENRVSPANPANDGILGTVVWRRADGSRPAEPLIPHDAGAVPSDFTPDGATVIYDGAGGAAGGDQILAQPVAEPGRTRELTEGPFLKFSGVISPDGRWLAYVAVEGGQNVVYVEPYAEGEGRWRISTSQGVEPRFSPDGRALFYRFNSVLYRAEIDTSRGFSAGRPEPWLERVASGGRLSSYGFSPDGARILTFRAPEGSSAGRLLHLDLGFAQRLATLAEGRR